MMQASVWISSPGVEFVYGRETLGWALSLNVYRRTQRPNMFSGTLERRFENVEFYEDCFVFLDGKQTFVILYLLKNPDQREQVDEIINRLLFLVGFK